MKRLFYGVLLLHLILWFSCTGSSRSVEGKEEESPTELLYDSSLTTFDFEGSWCWCWVDSHTTVSMRIFSNKDSVGDYLYTYYFGNRIQQGKVKLLSQEGRNAVLLVEYNDQREFHSWSSKFNATMLTDTSFFLTRQNHEDYYLEDSIVMRREHPERDSAEIRKLMEEFERRMSSRYKYLKD